jgi:microsomal epoxide hydrolase
MNVTHWTEFQRGGHFAAMERPQDLVEDIRTFARTLDK